MSNKRLKNISRKVKAKGRSYQSTFEQRHGMPDAVSGGNGLFLMTEQLVTNIGRAPRRRSSALWASYGSPRGSTSESRCTTSAGQSSRHTNGLSASPDS